MASRGHTPRYAALRQLLESFGGTMEYYPGGGPGGTWILCLAGKKIEVGVHDRRVNALDRFYVANVPDPQTRDDYAPDAPLVPDVRAKLAALFAHGQDDDCPPVPSRRRHDES